MRVIGLASPKDVTPQLRRQAKARQLWDCLRHQVTMVSQNLGGLLANKRNNILLRILKNILVLSNTWKKLCEKRKIKAMLKRCITGAVILVILILETIISLFC